MDIEHKVCEILALSEQLQRAISDAEWDTATSVFQQRDIIIRNIFDNTSPQSESETASLRDMILSLQKSDQILIDKMTKDKDKLLADMIDASAGQKATAAYAKNV